MQKILDQAYAAEKRLLPQTDPGPESSEPVDDAEVIPDETPDDSGQDHHRPCRCPQCLETRTMKVTMYVEDFEGDWVEVGLGVPLQVYNEVIEQEADESEFKKYVRGMITGAQGAMKWAEETNWGRDTE